MGSRRQCEKDSPCTGLHEKQVKDINAALLDDSLVNQDKIGQVNVFWSFPAAQGVELQARVEAARTKLAEATAKLAKAREAEQHALVGREDVDGSRAAKLKEYRDLVEKRKALEAEALALKENDPEELARIQQSASDFKDHANRWADNLFALKRWLVKEKRADPSQVDLLFKSVGLPEDIELD